MWAAIPMFLSFEMFKKRTYPNAAPRTPGPDPVSRSPDSGDAPTFGIQPPKIDASAGGGLPAIVSERAVGLRHPVRILTLLDGAALVLVGIHQLAHQTL